MSDETPDYGYCCGATPEGTDRSACTWPDTDCYENGPGIDAQTKQADALREQWKAEDARSWRTSLSVRQEPEHQQPEHQPCCTACSGKGITPDGQACWDCRGSGCAHPPDAEVIHIGRDCPDCGGSGQYQDGTRCNDCRGNGVVHETPTPHPGYTVTDHPDPLVIERFDLKPVLVTLGQDGPRVGTVTSYDPETGHMEVEITDPEAQRLLWTPVDYSLLLEEDVAPLAEPLVGQPLLDSMVRRLMPEIDAKRMEDQT